MMVLHKQEKLVNRLVCGNVLSYSMLKLMVIWKLTVPGFTHLVVHQKYIYIYGLHTNGCFTKYQ